MICIILTLDSISMGIIFGEPIVPFFFYYKEGRSSIVPYF